MAAHILCKNDFTTLVSLEAVFIPGLYIIVPLSVIKLINRKM